GPIDDPAAISAHELAQILENAAVLLGLGDQVEDAFVTRIEHALLAEEIAGHQGAIDGNPIVEQEVEVGRGTDIELTAHHRHPVVAVGPDDEEELRRLWHAPRS